VGEDVPVAITFLTDQPAIYMLWAASPAFDSLSSVHEILGYYETGSFITEARVLSV
jgi:hypothetical protein